jgi:hypothetical protein
VIERNAPGYAQQIGGSSEESSGVTLSSTTNPAPDVAVLELLGEHDP